MPLVRLELRNEYGLGSPELYRAAARREDPKAVLDGVAVSGLVGILRQLGDLAGFAAEVFRDLHEQIAATSMRAHRMSSRIQNIESSLPSIEEAMESQTSHIHFSYLPGSDWHPDVRLEHDHLLCSDLPRFIMDSYEECRDPPRLFLLDKYDCAGSGACLKRYSDPTYFKRVCASAQRAETDRLIKEKKTQKRKIKGLQTRNTELQHIISLSRQNNRASFTSVQFSSSCSDEHSTVAETSSAFELRLKYDLGSRSASFDSRSRISCAEPVPSIHSSEPQESVESVDNEKIETMSDVSIGNNFSSVMSDEFLQSNTTKESLQQQDHQSSDRWVITQEPKTFTGLSDMAIAEGVPNMGPEAEESLQQQDHQSSDRWVITQEPKTFTELSDMAIAEGVQNLGPQPADFGNFDHREDGKLEKPAEDASFDVGKVTFGESMSEHNDKKSKPKKLTTEILDEEKNASNQMDALSTHNGDVDDLAEKNVINDANMLLQGVLAPKQENEETTDKELPENVQAYTISSKNQRFEAESSDDFADTLSREVELSSSRMGGKSGHPGNSSEDLTSEAENYLDALTTIDSESERESDHQKIREPRVSSISSHSISIGPRDAQETAGCTSDSSNNEFNVLPPSCQNTFPDPNISHNSSFPESLHGSGIVSKGQHKSDDLFLSCNRSKYDSSSQDIVFDQSSVNVSNSENEGTAVEIPTANKSQEVCEISQDPSFKIWTNACLFGVQPSKPPDFSSPLTTDQASASISPRDHCTEQPDRSDLSLDASSLENKPFLKPNDHISNNHCTEDILGLHHSSCPQPVTSAAAEESMMLDEMKEPNDPVYSAFRNDHKSKAQDHVDSGNGCLKYEIDDISEFPSEAVYPVRHNLMDKDAASLGKNISVSRLPPLVLDDESHVEPSLQSSLLDDTSQIKSLSNAENLLPPSEKLKLGCLSAPQTCPSKEVQAHDASITNREIEAVSSSKLPPLESRLHCSSPPSPPLENMKISFHPMNGVANSKLKLEFPGGDVHKNIEELIFPSFQLLSGNSASQLHISSESDDDTFCRSSPYLSDNIVSPHSDTGSDSELWELEEKEIRLQDVKLEDNISTAFQSSHSLDLPSLDSLKEKNCSPENMEPNGLYHPTLNPLDEQPPPPPLPPLQWRMTKTSLPLMGISPRPSDGSKLHNQQVEQTPSQLPGHAAPLSPIDVERTIYRSKSMIEMQKLNGSKEVKAAKANYPVDADNMLYQLRSRSSLRPAPSRPSFSIEQPTNVKVAAILEKADAIRQAYVQGDGEGDDNWSDS